MCILDLLALRHLPLLSLAQRYWESLISIAVVPILSWFQTALWRGWWGGICLGFSLLPSLPAVSWILLLAGGPAMVPASTSAGNATFIFFPFNHWWGWLPAVVNLWIAPQCPLFGVPAFSSPTESIFCIKVSLTTQVVFVSWLDFDDTHNFLSTCEITFQTFVC